MTDKATILAETIAQFRAMATALRAAIDPNDWSVILHWPSGLAVNWANGKPYACGTIHARAFADLGALRQFLKGQVVKNGNGEQAVIRARQACIKTALAEVEAQIKTLESL